MYFWQPSPAILPEFTAQFSLTMGADQDRTASADCPIDLRDAGAIRRQEFAAGRYCARTAIAKLDDRRSGEAPGRGADGAPTWPAGLTGSITHAGGFVSAAVARADRIDGLGIDTERIVTAEVAREIAELVTCPAELDRVAGMAGFDRATALSLCFSAKESLFKCLYPLARRFFDFADAEIVRIDPNDRSFTGRLRIDLNADLPAGCIIHGRYALDRSFVHTGTTFRRPRDACC